MERIGGSCLCGQVTFECDNSFFEFHLCHCSQCQKATGTAHASNLFTAKDNIRWLSGQEMVKRYDVPGRCISKAFCTECGAYVPYLSLTGRALVVPAGSLDGTPAMVPQDNIFWAERAPWYDAGLKAKHFERAGDE